MLNQLAKEEPIIANIVPVKEHKPKANRDDRPLTVVEQMPQLPGGDAEMHKYIQ